MNMLRGLLKPFIGGGSRTTVQKPPSEASKVVVPGSERRISSVGRPRHPSAQNITAAARTQTDSGSSSINGTSTSKTPAHTHQHDEAAASGQSDPNSSSTWARKKDLPRAKHAPLHRRRSAARIMKNPPLVDLTEDTTDDGQAHAHASRQRSYSESELRKKAPPPARMVTASEDNSETMTEPSDEGRRAADAKEASKSNKILISSSDDEIYSRQHKRKKQDSSADGSAVAIRKSACKVTAEPKEARLLDTQKEKKKKNGSEEPVNKSSPHVSYAAQRLETRKVSLEQPAAKAGVKRHRIVADESQEEQEWHAAATRRRDADSMLRAPHTKRKSRSPRPQASSGKRVCVKSPQRTSVAATGPVRRSTQTRFDLTYDYHAVYKFALAKINAEMVKSAMKLCYDTLFAWYREARDMLYLIEDSLGKDDSSRMRLCRLRDRLAGMWCVCAHVLIEIGERNEDPSYDFVEEAGDLLVAARSCPIVGNHPWIILAHSRLQFYGAQSLDDIRNAAKVALATCNDGLRSSPSLHVRKLLEDTEAAWSRSLDEQNITSENMLYDLASMIKACQAEFSSTFLFGDGARILLFEVNRLSLMQERLLDGTETAFNQNLHFGLGRFRHFDAVDLQDVTWQTPPDVSPGILTELALGRMISQKRTARRKEDYSKSVALTLTDQVSVTRPVSRVEDVEYICSGCRQCGFSTHSELEAHESKCTKVQYTCPSCHRAKYPSTEELEAHKALCPYVRSLPVANVTKSPLSSLDQEESKGYLRLDLIDSLDYLVEFTTVTKKDVKSLKRRQQAAGDTKTTTPIPQVGQVGLRCLFCRHRLHGIGDDGSYIFPPSTFTLSRCMWRLCLTHLDRCENLPPPVKQRYQEFRHAIPMTDPTHDSYWRTVGDASFDNKGGGGGIYWK